MEIELPCYALRRSDSGRWVVWAPADDPRLPAVTAVAVIDEPQRRSRVQMFGLVPRFDVCAGAETMPLPEWYLD